MSAGWQAQGAGPHAMAARPDITVETLVGLSDEIEAWTRTARRQEQDQEQGQNPRTRGDGFGEQRRPPRDAPRDGVGRARGGDGRAVLLSSFRGLASRAADAPTVKL